MPTFSGKFQYQNPDGTPLGGGSCRLSFEKESFTLTPTSGAPIAFDLGDIEIFTPADYELTLTLYTGQRIVLSQFGKTFQNLSHDLLEAYRRRLVQCLLLEDLEEVSRFEGMVQLRSQAAGCSFASPAELRLYKSNLAVLPTQATGLQWRLAEIDSVEFDDATYAVSIRAGEETLVVTKLAKRTGEFRQRLEEGIAEITEKAAQATHELLPFLNPDQFQLVAQLLKEGHAVSVPRLKTIHPKTETALVENIVDAKLRPYFDALLARVPTGIYTGFKFIRKGEEDSEEPEAGTPETSEVAGESAPADQQPPDEEAVEGASEEKEPILHWFFFPLATRPGAPRPGNLVAWEATSRGGRATYFFRLVPPEQAPQLEDSTCAGALVDTAIRQLNRALVLLNFRREPIYLSDEKLELQPRYRRYAIACRKLPELRRLRTSFLGRAIHTSPEAWLKQAESFLNP